MLRRDYYGDDGQLLATHSITLDENWPDEPAGAGLGKTVEGKPASFGGAAALEHVLRDIHTAH
jgi:hypothetical protein